MNGFEMRGISGENESIAKQLVSVREGKKLSLFTAARDLKINLKYLEALESGNRSGLPPGIYERNYLQAYAEYLGLDVEKIMEQYDSEFGDKPIGSDGKLFVQKATKAWYFFSIPKALKIIFIIFAVSVCLAYIGMYLNNIISAPELIIIYPADDISTNDKKITLSGITELEAEIVINGKEVLTDNEGYFSDEIILKNGLNVIKVVSQKKYSRKNEAVRNVLVEEF
jgi:transcriptional regulator with XRE-family HTH domain